MRAPVHKYTDEQRKFIKDNILGRSRKEMLQLFNDRFGTDLTVTQITSFLKRNKLKNGNDGRFKKGQASWNKGMKGINFGGENGKKTQFQKGQTPYNYLPIGTERENGEGYVDVKIADPRTWKAKHHLIWEDANGPIPEGHVVIFADRNRRNFELSNLILISRRQLSFLNKHHLIQKEAELTKTGIIVADILGKISERERKKS